MVPSMHLAPLCSIQDRHQASALHWASSAGHVPVVRFLHEDKLMDLNAQDKYRRTCLYYAARQEKRHRGQPAQNGSNCLEPCCRNGHADMVRYLLDKGVDASLQLRDIDGQLVIDVAEPHMEVLSLIKSHVKSIAAAAAQQQQPT